MPTAPDTPKINTVCLRAQFERVDALECSQPRGGNRTSIAQVEPLRHTGDVLGVYHSQLCIETALPIAELVCVDAVAEPNASDSCAFGDNNSRAVNSGHPGEWWSPWPSP